MTSEELLQKVRKIEIKTRGLSRNIFAGEYHSQFKGRGMAFSEVREYQPGDDVRAIDWNVTARMNRPYVKIYEEERELTVMLLVDVSGSRNFGTISQMKRDTMAEVAATLAFSTIENNDKVGVIFFSDKVEKFIPPKKGKSHVLHIIRELLSFEPEDNGTDINAALQYLTNAQKRRCTAFIISDLMDVRFSDVRSTKEMEEEFGDLLFSLINVARLYKIKPDNALEKTNLKFIRRFNYIEEQAKAQGKAVNELTLEEMETYWQGAKNFE